MNSYTADMVTHCFGRYLIDLPSDFKPADASAIFAIAPYSEFSGALHVSVTPMSKTRFDQIVAQRQKKLENMHIMGEPDLPYLDTVIPLNDGSGVIFNRSEDGGSRGARTLELHGWKQGYAIKMTIDARDDNYPEYQDLSENLRFGSDVKQKVSILQSLYARTRGRQPDEIPTEPGTCIKNGFISGHASSTMREDIALTFVSKAMPKTVLYLTTDSGIGALDDTLLDRVPDLKRVAKAAGSEFLKKGSNTTQSGISFDEVLIETPTPKNIPSNLWFKLEANSQQGNTKAPLLDIRLERTMVKIDAEGNPIETNEDALSELSGKHSLSEAEAVALWNTITASLRKRPDAF